MNREKKKNVATGLYIYIYIGRIIYTLMISLLIIIIIDESARCSSTTTTTTIQGVDYIRWGAAKREKDLTLYYRISFLFVFIPTRDQQEQMIRPSLQLALFFFFIIDVTRSI